MSEVAKFDCLSVENEEMRDMTITVQVPFMAICPVPNKPYEGTITIEYQPVDKLLEWDSFAGYVKSLRTENYTAENLLLHIVNELWEAVQPRVLHVSVEAKSVFHLPVVLELYREDPYV